MNSHFSVIIVILAWASLNASVPAKLSAITLRFGRSWHRFCYCSLLLVVFAGQAHAATCTSTAAGGNWGTAGTWTGCGGAAPLAGDTVVIATTGASLVTVNVATAAVASLTVNGGAILTVAQTLNITSAAA